MAKLSELQKYLNYEFSTGVYTGKDYTSFQTKYINYLCTLCKEYEWTLTNIGRNHYNFTAFIRNKIGQYVYFSISDVRFWRNEWYNHILIRTAKNEKDYHGGSNYYTALPELAINVTKLFNRGCLYPFKDDNYLRGAQ